MKNEIKIIRNKAQLRRSRTNKFEAILRASIHDSSE